MTWLGRRDRESSVIPSPPQAGEGSAAAAAAAVAVALLMSLPLAARAGGPEDILPSGNIRLRAYDTEQPTPGRNNSRDFSGQARAQGSLRAEWPQDIALRVTARADAWLGKRDRDDDARLSLGESYLDLRNIAFMPLSLKAGRQHLHYGEGLILSGRDEDWTYDAGGAMLDIFPTSLEVLYARMADISPDSAVEHFVWANIRHEIAGGAGRNAEAYFGSFSLAGDAHPLLAGLRATPLSTPAWRASAEAGYQFGDGPGGGDLSAALLDAGLQRFFPDAPLRPALRARWTYASGDDPAEPEHAFIPLMNHEDWGRVLSPRLSNIHILGLRGSLQPMPRLELALDVFHYRQDEPLPGPASDGTLSNGGYLIPAGGTDRELGTEVDLGLRWKPSDGVALEVSAGRFLPGAAYAGQPDNDAATEVCVEFRAKF